MARSCGIRIGPRRYEIVVLDGTAKKHRIKAFRSAEFDTSAEDFGREVQDSIREAIRDLNVPKENVGLVIDSGHAAFRHLSLPLDDLSKVDQVIKFEVESKLPQWNIEDVVVDYILQLVRATRAPNQAGLSSLTRYVEFGASPRASIATMAAARAHALLDGRPFVTPDDVKAIAPDVLRHRILLSYEAEAEELTSDQVIQQILERVRTP